MTALKRTTNRAGGDETDFAKFIDSVGFFVKLVPDVRPRGVFCAMLAGLEYPSNQKGLYW